MLSPLFFDLYIFPYVANCTIFSTDKLYGQQHVEKDQPKGRSKTTHVPGKDTLFDLYAKKKLYQK